MCYELQLMLSVISCRAMFVFSCGSSESKDDALLVEGADRKASCLPEAIRCHGECAEVIVESADPSEPPRRPRDRGRLAWMSCFVDTRVVRSDMSFIQPGEGSARRCVLRRIHLRARASSAKGRI
jgi:hypothetical protein